MLMVVPVPMGDQAVALAIQTVPAAAHRMLVVRVPMVRQSGHRHPTALPRGLVVAVAVPATPAVQVQTVVTAVPMAVVVAAARVLAGVVLAVL